MASTRRYIQVTQEGDWLRVRDTFRGFGSGRLIEKAQDIIKKELDEAKELLIMEIEQQTMGHAELSDSWAKYKGSHGLDPRTLIATGEYLESFTVSRIGNRTWKLHPKGQEELAEWLEYGTNTMPARPHWYYVNDSIEALIRNALIREFKDMTS